MSGLSVKQKLSLEATWPVNWQAIKPEDLGGSTDGQTWNSSHTIFRELVERVKPEVILEVGSWKGWSAIQMAKWCKPSTDIVCVDTWLGSFELLGLGGDLDAKITTDLLGYPNVYRTFLKNIKFHGFTHKIHPIPNTSLVAYRVLRHLEVRPELIYIDAGHSFEDVVADVNAYWQLLAPGGVIFGDDYSLPGVKQAVDLFFPQHNDTTITPDGQFWYVEKPR